MKRIRALKVAVIGAGRHASANLHPVLPMLGVPVCAVLTRSLVTAAKAAERLGATRYYDDLDVMLKSEELDAVVISVEPDDQASLTRRCVSAGVAVFVEKPLGLNAADAREVAACEKNANAPIMVAFMKRFAPVYQRLHHLLSDGSNMGRILTVNAEFSFAPWTDELRADTFLQLGAIHMVDLLRAQFGDARVSACQNSSERSDIGLGFSMTFEGGVAAVVSLSATSARPSTYERITVVGSAGWVQCDNLTTLRYGYVGSDSTHCEAWDAQIDESEMVFSEDSNLKSLQHELLRQGFVGELQHFLHCVADGKVPTPSARENVATMAFCDDLIALL